MIWKKVTLALVLVVFLTLTAKVLHEYGYLEFFSIAGSNSATQLLMLDLVISLTLITIWMVGDAARNGRAFVPFVLITLFFGVAGPLGYLLTRTQGKLFQRVTGGALLAALIVAGVAL
jgi:hypothetical protein